ncbi:MAG: 4-hydroxybenzoate octaprenyltransferase [Gammaproteobacteria bacterium]|nr:4-hydroxybenzoate octaprenyltransferase [Gammaproteobacteria bacterium]MCY4358357.1 4-hydroxybenzoate octaprenyltransferase [Gammaproteobacteria bacterium]
MSKAAALWTEIEKRFQTRFPIISAKLPAYIELTRFDRPIGILLLLWPTIGALWIASEGFPDLDLLIIFLLGTTVMRAGGCAINDFADYQIDGHVQRTKGRPLARGALTRQEALGCFVFFSLLGFGLVLLTNSMTIQLAFAAVGVVAVYPFMKRFTSLPQLVLGIAFSMGILMAFSAQNATVPMAAFLLVLANVLWTMVFDTEYAMVDREYDKKIGVKSTAILFGEADRLIIGVLQILFVAVMWLAGWRLGLGIAFFGTLLVAAGLLVWQQVLIRDRSPDNCFRAFLNNNRVGAVIFLGIFINYL